MLAIRKIREEVVAVKEDMEAVIFVQQFARMYSLIHVRGLIL